MKKKNSFHFSLEEKILFCFFYVHRTVWCSTWKPLPTQTQASSSVEEEIFSFLRGRKNIILLFFMYVGQCGVPLEYFCPPRQKPLDQQKKKKCFLSFSMSVGQRGVLLENHCPPRQEPVHKQKKNCFLLFLCLLDSVVFH